MTTTFALPHISRRGVVLNGVSWQAYERIGRELQDQPIRINYDRGTLEIMTTSSRHERRKSLLRKMIDALAEEMRIQIASYGSMTFKRKARQKGLEPDECYWVQHEAEVRGRDEITLQNAPPPDLVLEVEVSRSVLSRIGIYKAFAVPEVWRCRQKVIRVVRLLNGKYEVSDRSAAFPFLNPMALLPFLNQPLNVSEVEMILAFREWVRQQQSAGWPNGGVCKESFDMTTILTPPRARRRLARRGIVLGVSWQGYERIGRTFQDRPIRITYDRGQIEIMTTSNKHERFKHLIRRLLEVLWEELNIETYCAGSMTFKRKILKKGLEPDECFWIQNEPIVRGRMDYDIERDPPPDLVLEVEISRSALNRMGIYAAMKVPEVWRCNHKVLKVCRLVDGEYQVVPGSLAFPFLDPAAILKFLNEQPPTGELTLTKAFRAWIRDQQAAGWPNGGV